MSTLLIGALIVAGILVVAGAGSVALEKFIDALGDPFGD